MIFVTVGAQMPFDRMVRMVDAWAERTGRTDVFAQIGETDYRPAHLRSTAFLAPEELRRHVAGARAIVGHAGMGSIITALEHGKPMLVVPREGRLGETRNDHQVATAERLSTMGYVSVAMDEEALFQKLDDLQALDSKERIPPFASAELLGAIRRFIEG